MTLDLSLPDAPKPKSGKLLQVATLLVAVAAVVLLILYRGGTAEGDGRGESGAGMIDRALAENLEKRTLWREAAGIWEARANSAKDLFRAGRCRMLAGEPERAVRDLLAAEAAGLNKEQAAESSRLVLEALAVLGKFDVRNLELTNRTGGEAAEGADVVARVGEEAITREELRAAVRDEEVARLLQTGGLDRDSLDRAVTAHHADKKRLLGTLLSLISRRALALEALSQGMGDRPELARRMAEVRRDLLGTMLIEDRLLEGIAVSDAELKDHWKAHQDRYTEPEAARFAMGETADDLAPAPEWHEKGTAFPDGLGRSAEADALLFSLEPGETSDRAVKLGDREVFLKLDELRPARVIPFEEARPRVAEDIYARKRADAVQAVREKVRANHPVEILDEELKRAREEAEAGGR